MFESHPGHGILDQPIPLHCCRAASLHRARVAKMERVFIPQIELQTDI